MEFKFVRFYLALLALASTSAENRNFSINIGPVLVPEHLLPILLGISESLPPTTTDAAASASMWSRMMSPFNRMVSYLRQSFCSPTPSNCSCGIKGSNRILGGQPAGQEEWPWQAFLFIDKAYLCAGSLISENWVVTASHCVHQKSEVIVILGMYNLTSFSHEHATNGTIVTHPNYNSTSLDNDIALVKLNIPATFSSKIRPICLPYKYATRDFNGETAVVTGWGTTSEDGARTNILLEVSMSVLNRVRCTNSPSLIPPSYITNNMICMYKGPGYGSCGGDSGGPVNWQGRSNTYLIGVVSFGFGCGRSDLPSVYVKVTNYLSWINSITGQSFCNL